MQFIDQVLINAQTNSDFLNFIGILLTALVSIYIFKKESSTSFVRERHDKLIFPLFNLLEPFLYQDIPANILHDALKIIEENKNIADGKLLEIFYLCSHYPSQQKLNHLCSYVDKMYDKSCWKLGLKLRSMTYRINRNQYRHKIYIFIYIVLYSVFSIFIGMVFFGLALCGIAALYSLIYATANAINHFAALLILMLFLILLMKYVDKHY